MNVNKEILDKLTYDELLEAILLFPKIVVEEVLRSISSTFSLQDKYFFSMKKQGLFWNVYNRSGIPNEKLRKSASEIISKNLDKSKEMFYKLFNTDLLGKEVYENIKKQLLISDLPFVDKLQQLFEIEYDKGAITDFYTNKITLLEKQIEDLTTKLNSKEENKKVFFEKIKASKKNFIVDEINGELLRTKDDFMLKLKDNNSKIEYLLNENQYKDAYDYLLLNYVLIKELEIENE